MYKVTIPMRLPGLNEFIDACKTNKYYANSVKRQVQDAIGWYLLKLPEFRTPITIKFTWVSTKDDRRDLDNICFAKKFILDALQDTHKITNDNRKHVVGFIDYFEIGSNYEVRLEIEEIKSYRMEENK